MKAEDLFDFVNEHEDFLYVSFFGHFGYFEDDTDKIVLKEIEWTILKFDNVDGNEKQLEIDMKEVEDWSDFIEDGRGCGYYCGDAVFRIQEDGDDFVDWQWYELEHAVVTFAYGKENGNIDEGEQGLDTFFMDNFFTKKNYEK